MANRYGKRVRGYKSDYESEVASRNPFLKYEPRKYRWTEGHLHSPDFLLPNGTWVEAKGVLDLRSRRILRAMKEQHPDVVIRILFMKASKRVSGTNLTNGEWASRNSFEWSEGTKIPQAWYERSYAIPGEWHD